VETVHDRRIKLCRGWIVNGKVRAMGVGEVGQETGEGRLGDTTKRGWLWRKGV